MKKLLLSALALLLALPLAASAGILSDDEGELSAQAAYFFPGGGDFDLFENGIGSEVSYREWIAFPWGIGLSLGASTWSADDKANCYKIPGATDFDGDVTAIPLGLHFYFNIIDWDNWNVILQTGLRYVIVDSDVDFVYDGGRRKIDMDNDLLWDIALEYDHSLSENIFFTLTGGFQTDIMKADSTYKDGNGSHDLRDTSFEAFFARAGIKVLF